MDLYPMPAGLIHYLPLNLCPILPNLYPTPGSIHYTSSSVPIPILILGLYPTSSGRIPLKIYLTYPWTEGRQKGPTGTNHHSC